MNTQKQIASRNAYENPEVEFIDVILDNVIMGSCTNDIEKPDPCSLHEEDV